MSEAKSEMVERIALAIMESYGCEDGSDGLRACVVDHCSCRNVARAAIASMREPTEAMLKAAYASCDDHGHVLIKHGYRAMIDEALSGSRVGHPGASVAPVLDPAAVSDRANEERRPEPNFGPEGVS